MRHRTRLAVVATSATVLSTLCLSPVLRGAGWFPVLVLMVLVVTGSAELARGLGCQRPLVPLVGLAGLVAMLTAYEASSVAWLGFLPNGGVLRLAGDLVTEGRHEIASYAAPVAAQPGVMFLTASGVGLVAVAVDTLAVTYRRPALGGLPLLGIYAVPALVVPDGVGWVAFSAGVGGFLWLLLTDSRERVSRWGRVLHRTSGPLGSGPLTATGRRVGAAAIGAALLVPAAVPGIATGLVHGTGPGRGHGHGGNHSVRVGNPFVDLAKDLNRPEPQEVLTYTSSAASPGYLRLASLDDFSGTVWGPRRLNVPHRQQVSRGLGTPTGLSVSTEAKPVRTAIVVKDYDSKWLPLPYPTRVVQDLEGQWVWEQTTFNVYPYNADDSTVGKSYTALSRDVEPTAAQLREAGPPQGDFGRFLELPGNVPAVITRTARDVTRDAQTDYDKAVALQEFFRNGSFSYTTKAPPGSGLTNIANFLRQRQGFCVHFASSMAVMARALRIPARVAVGFTPGEKSPDGGYAVSTNDAHAWPELYFEGAGWLAFEPTPAARTGAAPRAYAVPRKRTPTPGVSATTSARTSPSASPGLNGSNRDRQRREVTAVASSNTGTLSRLNWTAVAVVVALLLLLMSPRAARELVRRRRWRQAAGPGSIADAAWAETRDLAFDYGFDLPESLTPRQYVTELSARARLSPTRADALGRVARAAERSAYARSVGEIGDLRAAVSQVRAGLVEQAARGTRLRARFAPPSLLAVRYAMGERTADGRERLDRGSVAVRRLLRGHPSADAGR